MTEPAFTLPLEYYEGEIIDDTERFVCDANATNFTAAEDERNLRALVHRANCFEGLVAACVAMVNVKTKPGEICPSGFIIARDLAEMVLAEIKALP